MDEFEERSYAALRTLNGDQLYVIAALFWDDRTEQQTADEMSALRGVSVTRDRVHRIKLTAFARMRRVMLRDRAA